MPIRCAPCCPQRWACLAVVTSRSRLTGLVATEAARPLGPSTCSPRKRHVSCWSAVSAADRIAADPARPTELIRLCARLPLALDVAAARGATHPGLSLAALAAELRDAHGSSTAWTPATRPQHPGGVLLVLPDLSAPAARMFRLLGVHPGPDISAHAAASLAGSGRDKARAVLGELGRVSLIAEHVSGRFAFHDLLRAYAAEQATVIDGDAACQAAIHRVLDHYVHSASAAPGCCIRPVARSPWGRPAGGAAPEQSQATGPPWAWLDSEYLVLIAATRLAGSAGLRCPCLASSVVALRIPGPARAPAGLGRHPADRPGRRSPGWRPGRPGPRAP